MDSAIRNIYIIIYSICLLPVILIVGGAILRKSKKKVSKWLFIAGGLFLGLFVLASALLTFANMFLVMQ